MKKIIVTGAFGQIGGDLLKGTQGAQMLGLHLGTLRELFGNGGEDFNPFDGIDAEVAFQIHIGVDGFGRISGLVGNDGEKNRQDLGRRHREHVQARPHAAQVQHRH